MKTTGTIAPNFHEGTRSEYLAQYVFSGFGTSVPVPHPEDSGIDLYCTLGEKLGQRLHVQNYYYVQVKSSKEQIVYDGAKSVEWLLSHNYPLLICVVDKKNSMIEIYQTIILSTLYYFDGIDSITISFDPIEKFDQINPAKQINVCIGPPVVRFKTDKIGKIVWVEKARLILQHWIRLDQENINLKAVGLNLFRVPETYRTNEVFDEPKRFIGNFKISEKHQNNFFDMFCRLLSQLIHQVASEKNIKSFGLIADFAGLFLSRSKVKGSWGVNLVAFAVNSGAKYLKLSNRISITDENGKTTAPIAKISG